MTTKHLYATATNLSGILSVTVQNSHSAATGQATIQCTSIGNVIIGDAITINLGYTTDHGDVFTGYIKEINYDVPQKVYTLNCVDEMIRAVDYFSAPTDPDSAPSWSNISAESLVGNVMAIAGLTNYDFDTTYFTFAVNGDKQEFKMVTAYDFCKGIADLLAYSLWYDDGVVYFKDRKPYYTSGSTASTITDSMILTGSYRTSVKDLRNRIVVWGSEGIYASADASSPYLPSGFYKTVLFSHPMIDTLDSAQKAADFNLVKLNRLTKNIILNVIGNHIYKARTNIHLDSLYLPNNKDLYLFSVSHNWSQAGYTCDLDARF
jgi:hypothetical protein